MIEASIAAVPGLVAGFLILGALFALPTAFLAKARNRPWQPVTALAVYVAGILSVTLLPGDAGLEAAQCDTGAPLHLFTDTSSLLNIALFAPGAFLAVHALRRPVTAAAAFIILSGTVELIQSTGYLGRSCSLTDVAANATGSVLGAAVGAAWLLTRRVKTQRVRRDVVWGVGLLVAGAAALVSVFHTRIDSVNIVAIDDARQQRGEAAIQADAWLTEAARATFGDGTQIVSSSAQTMGDKLKITADTNRGKITGYWPEKHLESAWSDNNRGDEGNADQHAAAQVANRFARTWFSDSVKGSQQHVRTLGEGPTRAYLVTYRRYRDDVLMPMRLDITVTTTKRIMGFTARSVPDPSLPTVTIDESTAHDLAHKISGQRPRSAVLIAQQVAGTWRPVWLVGSGGKDIAIDAATGQHITTDK
ncbi:VanZ family protein [Streptomyces sp. NPDC002514]|uniref:VanZ family protein n=1 Tax=Streptomyces sp. NPDC001270 TaxID=3364554 RepID=UPI0036BEE834